MKLPNFEEHPWGYYLACSGMGMIWAQVYAQYWFKTTLGPVWYTMGVVMLALGFIIERLDS